MTPVAGRHEEPGHAAETHGEDPVRPHLVQPWPRGVSRDPVMRISDVLGQLGADFPTLTPSKLRFLEEQGLVEPRRTPAGYRQYSQADVERLRFILRQQRDRYLPLRVIGEQLAALDAGSAAEPLTPRLITADGRRAGPTPLGRFLPAALAEETGTSLETITALVEAGVVSTDRTGHLDAGAAEVVLIASALAEHGVQPRHLRSLRSAADREVALVDQIVAPLREQRAVAAQAHAATVAAEIGELFARLHAALVRAGVRQLAP